MANPKSKIPLLPPTTESGRLPDGTVIGQNVHGAFSTAYDWGSETTQGLRELVPEFCDQVYPTVNNFGAAFASTTPQLQLPVSASVAGLRTAIEANVGKAIGDILPNESGVDFTKVASMVGNIAGAAITGNVDTVAVAKMIGNVTADILDAIPILGNLCRAVLGAMWAQIDQMDRDAQSVCDGFRQSFLTDWKSYCGSLAKNAVPIATEAGTVSGIKGAAFQANVTAADTFRGLAYVFRKGSQAIPASPASLYLLLCGGEAQGFGFSRSEYKALHNSQRRKTNSGIPVATQRRMWKVIRALMSAAQPPGVPQRTSDQGSTLFPILQELVRTSFVAGHWDERWLQVLNLSIGRRHVMSDDTYFGCPYPSAVPKVFIHARADCGGSYRVPTSCSCTGPSVEYADEQAAYGMFFDLVPAFMASLNDWAIQMNHSFFDKQSGLWKVAPPAKARIALAHVPKISMIVLNAKQGKRLDQDVKSAADASKGIDPAEAARIKKAKELEARNRKAAIGTTAVVLGAGSFVLARKAAKKKSVSRV